MTVWVVSAGVIGLVAARGVQRAEAWPEGVRDVQRVSCLSQLCISSAVLLALRSFCHECVQCYRCA